MTRILAVGAALALLAGVGAPASAHSFPTRAPALHLLFSYPAQKHPKMPKYHAPKFVCTTGSLGDQLCCVWRVLYKGYGFGVWDCTVVPASPSGYAGQRRGRG